MTPPSGHEDARDSAPTSSAEQAAAEQTGQQPPTAQATEQVEAEEQLGADLLELRERDESAHAEDEHDPSSKMPEK